MGWFYRFLIYGALLGVVGGGIFLMMWDIPPPSATVEKVIPHDRFTE